MSVITVLRYGEYLIVAFYLQGQTVFKLNPNEFQNLMQNGFAFRIERYIVSVFSTFNAGLYGQPQSLFHKFCKLFIYPVHEITETEVCEVLAQIIAYRKPVSVLGVALSLVSLC